MRRLTLEGVRTCELVVLDECQLDGLGDDSIPKQGIEQLPIRQVNIGVRAMFFSVGIHPSQTIPTVKSFDPCSTEKLSERVHRARRAQSDKTSDLSRFLQRKLGDECLMGVATRTGDCREKVQVEASQAGGQRSSVAEGRVMRRHSPRIPRGGNNVRRAASVCRPESWAEVDGGSYFRALFAHGRASQMSTRYNLVLAGNLERQLDEIVEQDESSKAEVLRKALALYITARNGHRRGMKVGFADAASNQLQQEIIGF